MESPVFELKEEPASPSWGLELLDEVGGIWEGDVEVVDEVELEDVFWGEQDISELIGKEEQILGLELEDIALDLDNEDDIDLKEEPFSNWLDSGAIYDGTNSTVSGLPTYQSGLWMAPESPADDKTSVFAPGGPAAPADSMQTAPADLLKEFEDVLSQAAGSLTPPDSPRSVNANSALLPLPASHIHSLPLSPPPNPGFVILQEMASSPVVSDELDELVAETYQKNGGGLATINKSGQTIKNEQTALQPKTGCQQPWDSPTSSSGSCDSGYEDPDWSPAKSAESSASSSDTPQPSKKLRLTSTEERRLRKKEQNKNAATRYRMKKKMEMEEIIGEEKELLDRNDSLKSEVVEITREIRYLKGLMRDLFRAKGLIRAK